jgi:hypothetical protein
VVKMRVLRERISGEGLVVVVEGVSVIESIVPATDLLRGVTV